MKQEFVKTNEEENKTQNGEKSFLKVSFFLKTFIFFVAPTLLVFTLSVIFLVVEYENLITRLLSMVEQGGVVENGAYVAKSLEELRILALAVASVFLVAVLAGSVSLVLILSSPLQNLMKGMRQVMKGDLSVSVDATTRDEVGELTRIFNTMIKRIRLGVERDQEVSTLKNEFVSIIAHQFRTPLTSVEWVLEALASDDKNNLTKEQRELIENGKISTVKLSKVLNDLLEMVQVEEGRSLPVFADTEIMSIISEIVKEYKEIAQEKGVNFYYESDAESLVIPIDAERFPMIVSSLLMNAIIYTPKGGSVNFKITTKGEVLRMVVQDTGIGISESDSPKLFTKFFRGKSGVLAHPDGSGISLYVIKNIIDSRGGEIRFESREGKGSVFYVEIPFKKPE